MNHKILQSIKQIENWYHISKKDLQELKKYSNTLTFLINNYKSYE